MTTSNFDTPKPDNAQDGESKAGTSEQTNPGDKPGRKPRHSREAAQNGKTDGLAGPER